MEETATVEQTQETQQPDISVALQNAIFGDEGAKQQAQAAQTTASTEATTQTSTAPAAESAEEIVDANEYLEKTLGFKTWDEAKSTIEELRTKSTKEPEFKFENEISKTAFGYLKEGKEKELYDFLNQKMQIERLTEAEINESNAADIVKFSMKQKYQGLTDEQINYKFNKQYGLPKEPVQGSDEMDEDFEQRKSEWQEKVNDIKTELAIEANIVRPEIAKLKEQLILPDILKSDAQSNQPSKEDIEAFNTQRESFLQSVGSSVSSFEGFTIQHQDKDVNYAVTYAPSNEEKETVGTLLKSFADAGFDANVIFAERWLNQDGKTINQQQMVKDLSLLYTAEKMHQKLVTDSGNKRLDEYLKSKKQIDVNGKSSGTFTPSDDKTEMDLLREAMLKV